MLESFFDSEGDVNPAFIKVCVVSFIYDELCKMCRANHLKKLLYKPLSQFTEILHTPLAQAFESWQVWDSNPLYALLQETIYTQGAPVQTHQMSAFC